MTADFVCLANFPNLLPNEVSYTVYLLGVTPTKNPTRVQKNNKFFKGE